MSVDRISIPHLLLVALALAMGSAAWGAIGPIAGPIEAPRVKVSLAAAQSAVAPGEAIPIGLHFTLDPHWHVYWQNPGDSGEAPRVRWTLPDGWTAQPIRWPAPERFEVGPLVNYGYSDAVLLPLALVPPADAAPGPTTISAKATWLVCREDCIPGKAVFELSLDVGGTPTTSPAPWPARFAAAEAARPSAREARFSDAGEHLELVLPSLSAPAEATVHFMAAVEGITPAASAQPVTRLAGGGLALRLSKADTTPKALEQLVGLVQIAGDPRQTYAVAAKPGPPSEGASTAAGAVAPSAPSAAPEQTSLVMAILFALLGGLLLNLMPCVFPVLSLKVLGFVEHAGDDPRQIRAQGWLFTAGVLVAFLALAGVLIALRAGGEQLGWGFQLQTPGFVAALAVLMFGLALSLSGVFEVGTSLTAAGGSGRTGAFATGALATVVATPCTAPFMGPALGFALTRPPGESLAVFLALGLGMASPYLVLAHAPRALERLPRPGPWMETFKQLMAFPLFATVLWLLDVFLQQTDVAAAGTLLVALLALAFAGWVWGRLQYSGRNSVAWAALALALAAPGLWLTHAATTFGPEPGESELWAPWSPAEVQRLRAESTPVFVNYTAAWCISCKVNERVVFQRESVRKAFARNGVVALEADWTDRDETIARELARHGRQGVPLYLFYPSGSTAPPVVLPSILTPDMVVAAVEGRSTPEAQE